MRSICLVAVDGKLRPALVLTAEAGPQEGLEHRSVITCENIRTVAAADLGREIGLLPGDRELPA